MKAINKRHYIGNKMVEGKKEIKIEETCPEILANLIIGKDNFNQKEMMGWANFYADVAILQYEKNGGKTDPKVEYYSELCAKHLKTLDFYNQFDRGWIAIEKAKGYMKKLEEESQKPNLECITGDPKHDRAFFDAKYSKVAPDIRNSFSVIGSWMETDPQLYLDFLKLDQKLMYFFSNEPKLCRDLKKTVEKDKQILYGIVVQHESKEEAVEAIEKEFLSQFRNFITAAEIGEINIHDDDLKEWNYRVMRAERTSMFYQAGFYDEELKVMKKNE